jgi:membrane-anchored protein YejM (alkaline phosphatase superfamily)
MGFTVLRQTDMDIWDSLGKQFCILNIIGAILFGKDRVDILESDSAEKKTQTSFKTNTSSLSFSLFSVFFDALILVLLRVLVIPLPLRDLLLVLSLWASMLLPLPPD